MSVFKRAGSPYWMIEFQFQGQTVRRSSGTTSKTKAKELEQQWRREIHDRLISGKRATLSFGEAIDRYYQTVLLPRGKPAARAKDLYILNRLRIHFGARTPLDRITSDAVAQYRDNLVRERGLKPSSANREISYLRAIINRAANDWNLSTAPFRVRMFKEPPGRVRWLTPDEEERLLKESAPHLRNVLTFLMDTGCRREEALALTWRDVLFDGDRVRIVIQAEKAKNSTAAGRAVPRRSADLLRRLQAERPKGSEHVFLYAKKRGKPRQLTAIKTAFNAACRRAGIDDLRVHDLRHHYASRLVQRGVPLQRVQHLLGHKSMRMTERYAHLAPSDLDDAVAVLDG